MSFQNLKGDVSVYELSLKLGLPAISSNKQYIEIPYRGTASPASSTVTMVKYQYSIDNGATYSDMTPVSSADINNLNFTEEGSDLVFNWDAKKDLGNDLYNKNIRVVLQVEEFGLTSTEAYRSIFFSRSTVNVEVERAKKPFPDSYEGLPGNKYKQGKVPQTK